MADLFLCQICYRNKTILVKTTESLVEAAEWKRSTQEFEDKAAESGFRGPNKYVVNEGGEDSIIAINCNSIDRGIAHVFAVDATEILV